MDQSGASSVEHWQPAYYTKNNQPERERQHRGKAGRGRGSFKAILNNSPLQQLTGTQIQKLYTLLRNYGISPNTVHLIHTILNAALNDAVKWHRIALNPCKHLTAPRTQKADSQFIRTRRFKTHHDASVRMHF
ncbi:phage integrase SAM-like domain-containing protein [Dictyobacter formicarum]|uniref:phage integrase SAM-like domain-containing protein n=1 Tax=Dictyobacter formicarum TaxID=2778368 RepID=UPI001914FBF2